MLPHLCPEFAEPFSLLTARINERLDLSPWRPSAGPFCIRNAIVDAADPRIIFYSNAAITELNWILPEILRDG